MPQFNVPQDLPSCVRWGWGAVFWSQRTSECDSVHLVSQCFDVQSKYILREDTSGWIKTKFSADRNAFHQWDRSFLPPPPAATHLSPWNLLMGNRRPLGTAWGTNWGSAAARRVNEMTPVIHGQLSLDPTLHSWLKPRWCPHQNQLQY